MIRISSTLMTGAVVTGIQCSSKAAVLAKLAALAAKTYGLDAAVLLDGLEEREHLGTTGFGGGTAIPHCKVAGIDAPVGVFLRLAKAVDYEAVDDEPVDLIFGLISPIHDGALHLRSLAEISRMLRDEKSCAQMRGAADSDALFALLTFNEERDAA
jgi:nitrogen PTS system EIIA component